MFTYSRSLILAVSAGFAMAQNAAAQGNTAVAPLDLIVTFQNPGGSTGATAIVTAVAGTTNTTARVMSFRDATPGTYVTLANLDAALDAAFGTNWREEPTLWMAGFGNTGTSSTQTTISLGDAQRTVYFTRARNDVGVVGQQNSVGFDNPNNSFYTSAANSMNGLKTQFEQQPNGGVTNNTPIYQNTTSTSNVDDALPFISGGIQGPAFGAIADGVQDNFGTGTLGTFGAAGTVELALDLYREQPGVTDAGPNPNVTGSTGVSVFLGTLTVNQAGELGFTAAIPEPSAISLLGGISVLCAGTWRRRRKEG